ncbi:sensor histidine kinase PilS, PAS domain-containing [Geotalea daltonii FRC-32]|uniref:histidine kinase n=1 Tax=Geotalea daltonii (strain DSM 22248 / JCM 15807 / FRC-32) TaxID=316067 RepID=B9M530_GEODF|nr:ATP-binding protein [Geotalea daltonii]ACM21714.1 sensor histidine kinase PilS, PAS domain-containing [Geotalea daltonii FRC-32]
MSDKKRLFWFIFLRVVVVSFFLVSTIILNLNGPDSINGIAFYGLIKVIIATYAFSIVSLLILKVSDKLSKALTYGQIIWDLALVTFLLIFTGGINSPYSFLYFLSIINASVFLARREAYYTASLCGILYGGIIDLQFFGSLIPFGLSQYPAQQYGIRYIFYTVFLNIAAYYLTAFLAGHLSERARVSETALHDKVVDYEELERLNSSIVSTLNSGLLTINEAGKIRVFNPYAEILTGIKQNEAYDRLLVDIIPDFAIFMGKFHEPTQGELDFFDKFGKKKVLGFKSVPLTDKDDSVMGVILDFQDLTQYKQMEAKLKRADRLAAVGELSARMAHEIRNPLASISGAVQLIAQSDATCAKDKQLLGIVLRETDRLNELIRDFLEYARPTPPAKIHLDLALLIQDLTSLLKADHRFTGISVDMHIPKRTKIDFDLQQCKQVFWNLLVNAAEAMPGGGEISVRAEVISDMASGISVGDLIKIEVIDNGMGMNPQDVKNVFEPFFTTKANGTGLGLATVYRIIESHGGIILVDSKQDQGTRFTVFLPQSVGERQK